MTAVQPALECFQAFPLLPPLPFAAGCLGEWYSRRVSMTDDRNPAAESHPVRAFEPSIYLDLLRRKVWP